MSHVVHDASQFHGRVIKQVEAFADRPVEPKRADYSDISDEEFKEVMDDYRANLAEWEVAQKGRTE